MLLKISSERLTLLEDVYSHRRIHKGKLLGTIQEVLFQPHLVIQDLKKTSEDARKLHYFADASLTQPV